MNHSYRQIDQKLMKNDNKKFQPSQKYILINRQKIICNWNEAFNSEFNLRKIGQQIYLLGIQHENSFLIQAHNLQNIKVNLLKYSIKLST